MEGVKKWFIACLTLLGLCVPSLLTSLDASALRYSYDALPVVQNYYIAGVSDSPFYSSDTVSFRFGGVFNQVANSDGYFKLYQLVNNNCQQTVQGPQLTYVPNSNLGFTDFTSGSNHASQYLYQNIGFGEVSDSVFCQNQSEIAYSAIGIGSVNPSTGNREQFVSIGELTSSYVTEDTDLIGFGIPLDLYWLDVPTIKAGTPLNFRVQFLSKYELTNLASNPIFKLTLKYYATDVNDSAVYYDSSSDQSLQNTYTSVTVTDYSLAVNEQGSSDINGIPFDYYLYTVDFEYTPQTDMSVVSVFAEGWGDDSIPSTTPLFHYDDLYFGNLSFVTNHDETWSGVIANESIHGLDIDSAPGYVSPESGGVCSADDYFCQLAHTFTFTFFNPFLPIFNMFSSQDQCANIPTIAGMLHSEETQVCPWFSSQTRQIATPVLSIASVMLVFGFAVRWLGSRSGKLIDGDPQND